MSWATLAVDAGAWPLELVKPDSQRDGNTKSKSSKLNKPSGNAPVVPTAHPSTSKKPSPDSPPATATKVKPTSTLGGRICAQGFQSPSSASTRRNPPSKFTIAHQAATQLPNLSSLGRNCPPHEKKRTGIGEHPLQARPRSRHQKRPDQKPSFTPCQEVWNPRCLWHGVSNKQLDKVRCVNA